MSLRETASIRTDTQAPPRQYRLRLRGGLRERSWCKPDTDRQRVRAPGIRFIGAWHHPELVRDHQGSLWRALSIPMAGCLGAPLPRAPAVLFNRGGEPPV